MGFFSRLMGGGHEQADKAPEFEILAPVSGELVPLEKTADPVFSGRAMGDGVAVDPDGETVLAPVSGTVAALFPTGHAFAISSDNSSAQVMVHIGIDTVKLNGEGFQTFVAQGDHVDAGQPVVKIDLAAIRAAGFDPTVFVVVCERAEGSTLRERAAGPVAAKEPVSWLSE
ncbi:PTS sugar transporter subunit IIA [Paratractidigestivibacter sp.]|uniref:PTS sugar transporter subunit IIA n=1 Tax=Paratractidigestivibacter sp. TaxID=2847316 RepID=UPI003AB2C7A3